MSRAPNRLLVAGLALAAAAYGANHFSAYFTPRAQVAAVHDGDTLTLEGGERVRIANIDAPETADSPSCRPQVAARRKTPAWCDFTLGEASRRYLTSLVLARRVAVHREGTDRYNRTLATLTLQGDDVGSLMVAEGLARAWRR